jgi:hypothetical protein
MSEILSREYSDAGLRHSSESSHLLEFIQRRLIYHTTSYQNSDNADLKGRAHRFILEVTTKTRDILMPGSNTSYNPHSKTLQLIIAVLDSEVRDISIWDILS